MSELILKRVEDFLNVLLPAEGLKLFDLQFRREGHGWVLRVYIDSDEGVTLDHCSSVSRELGQFLDVEDLIDHAYHLEVSSPGMERPLRGIDDFQRFIGEKARIKLHVAREGNKIFEGVIYTIEGDQVTLLIEGGQELQFTFDQVSKARLAI